MAGPAETLKLPTYAARRAVDAIAIDGKLDEASWQRAARISDFRDIFRPERQQKFPTEAAIVWDETNLYVAFSCTDDEPWGTLTKRDDHLWNEEVVEVFLDPDGDGLNYAELEVSPNNVVVDLLLARPRAPLDESIRWDIEGLQTAAERTPTGWVAEIAVPWISLKAAGVGAAPQPDDRWRVGLYRIKRPDRGRRKADDEYSAWSLTRADYGFHDPERFGYVQFVI